MQTALTVTNGGMDFDTSHRVSKAMVASGYFKDVRDSAQAIVKIMAGQEMGIGPFAAMSGINIIKGKPGPGANIIASLIKDHPRYDYRVRQIDNDVCSIAFFENDKEVGISTFTRDDAEKAGTQNMGKFARNMLFARAISNGAKWYTPNIFGGAPVYTPEELGAPVDGDGDVIDMTPTVAKDVPGGVLVEHDLFGDDPRGSTSPQEQAKRERPAANGAGKVNGDGPPDDMETVVRENEPGTFALMVETIPYFKHENHAKNALKKLKYNGWPSGTENAAKRVEMYQALVQYAADKDYAAVTGIGEDG